MKKLFLAFIPAIFFVSMAHAGGGGISGGGFSPAVSSTFTATQNFSTVTITGRLWHKRSGAKFGPGTSSFGTVGSEGVNDGYIVLDYNRASGGNAALIFGAADSQRAGFTVTSADAATIDSQGTMRIFGQGDFLAESTFNDARLKSPAQAGKGTYINAQGMDMISAVAAGVSISTHAFLTTVTQGSALCVNSGGKISVCTSAVGVGGACTCP